MPKILIILHGWGADANRFDLVKEWLTQKGYTVWAPDLPGFGSNPAPPQSWSVQDYADWVKAQIEGHAWSSFAILGHSFGGRIAIKLASQQLPGLEKLVLVGVPGLKLPRTLTQNIYRLLAKAGQKIFQLPGLNIFQDLARRLLYRSLGEYDYLHAQGVMKTTLVRVLEEDLKPDLAQIRVPTLLLWGHADQLVPVRIGQLIHDHIRNSQLRVFADLDHNFIYEPNEKVKEKITEFLSTE